MTQPELTTTMCDRLIEEMTKEADSARLSTEIEAYMELKERVPSAGDIIDRLISQMIQMHGIDEKIARAQQNISVPEDLARFLEAPREENAFTRVLPENETGFGHPMVPADKDPIYLYIERRLKTLEERLTKKFEERLDRLEEVVRLKE